MQPTFVHRGRLSAAARLHRLRTKWWTIGQCAVAAGLAWLVAVELFGHQTPFFAPIAAVVSLGTSYGQRVRRVAEVTVGVAIGVLVGDVFTQLAGTGAWQLVVIVALAMSVATLLDTGILFVNQAAVQAIVVSTLLPVPDRAFTRWTDALIGGGVALVVASVVPRAPLRQPRQQAAQVLRRIGELLRSSADCLDDGDVDHAVAVLADARATDVLIDDLQRAADEGFAVLASSPWRRRHRHAVRRISERVESLDFALRNTRVLARRVAVVAYRREPVASGYSTLCRDLGDCADTLARELDDDIATTARSDLIALGDATARIPRTHDLSSDVILAQVRSIIADLLAVSGMDPFDATDAIPPRE